jgi:mono/diheme cytochrome c family protein
MRYLRSEPPARTSIAATALIAVKVVLSTLGNVGVTKAMARIRVGSFGRRVFGGGFKIIAAAFLSLAVLAGNRTDAQNAPTAEEARQLEFGMEIFKSKAVCQYCHKWDASGDQGYGGNALSLRKTQLTPEQLAEVVKCGRPGTGMPYHDRFAYTDKRCFGHTREEMGNDVPPAGNDFLSNREIDAVVKYLFAKAVGRGEATYGDCIDFWGKDTRQCEPMKQ